MTARARARADKILAFEVLGVPVPCARPRVFRNHGRSHTITDPRTEAYEQLVAWSARAAIVGARWVVGADGPFRVELTVHRAARRGDVDNFSKSILDGMTRAGVWSDDSQVDELLVRLRVDRDAPRVDVRVERRA